ncbi:MAG: hypothetical protein H6765_09165 [Candidatus Peribacteria bacterium]|nr:MAG: hypothetical protein H6765_09165 [Candidatus Peribacteria bacterium]
MAGTVLTVDCDNVLCNTAHAFLQYYHEVYGDLVAFDMLSEPYPHQIAYFPEFAKDDVFAAYLEFFAYAEEREWLLPLPGALPVLQQLQADGHDLQVIT